MKNSGLSLQEKPLHNIGLLLSKCPQVLTLFNTELNTIEFNIRWIFFDDFGVWLLGYMFEFKCLYISQGHYLVYFVVMKYR